MTDRDRLIELLKSDSCESPMLCDPNCKYASLKSCYEERTADFLLENGVIVPPVKVGERRIDDLGRVHIPKNVRLSLGINYGDVISISVSDANIILKKEREQK
ncbi:MAG: AbrB/MazE/SpoVT family DNA-binding domain-containing protein [Huintestinicola sp.]